MTCKDCIAAATDPTWGGYHATCDGCTVRAIAQSPRHIRDLFYERELIQRGAAALAKLKSQVRTEHERLRELKGTPVASCRVTK